MSAEILQLLANEPKAETVNEKDEKEEKTSNGNHTPV